MGKASLRNANAFRYKRLAIQQEAHHSRRQCFIQIYLSIYIYIEGERGSVCVRASVRARERVCVFVCVRVCAPACVCVQNAWE